MKSIKNYSARSNNPLQKKVFSKVQRSLLWSSNTLLLKLMFINQIAISTMPSFNSKWDCSAKLDKGHFLNKLKTFLNKISRKLFLLFRLEMGPVRMIRTCLQCWRSTDCKAAGEGSRSSKNGRISSADQHSRRENSTARLQANLLFKTKATFILDHYLCGACLHSYHSQMRIGLDCRPVETGQSQLLEVISAWRRRSSWRYRSRCSLWEDASSWPAVPAKTRW